jgi:hypothetical protein
MSLADRVRTEPARLMQVAWQLPPTVADRLRKMALDKFSGNVELNIKLGRICGFTVREQVELPKHEIL